MRGAFPLQEGTDMRARFVQQDQGCGDVPQMDVQFDIGIGTYLNNAF